MQLKIKDGKIVPALLKREAKLLTDAKDLCDMIAQLRPLDEKMTQAAAQASDNIKSLVGEKAVVEDVTE